MIIMAKKSKLEKILITTSICPLFLLPVLINNKDQIYLSFKSAISNVDENIYPTAKVGPLYDVQTLRKVTNDADAINVLFLGDNYGPNENPNTFSDFIHQNVVIPWLSTTYPNTYNEYKNQTHLTRGTRIPFQTYLNDKINVYSIQPNFKENNSIVNSKDTFFGVYTTSSSSSSHFYMPLSGYAKVNVLNYDLSNNFLQDGGINTLATTAVIRNKGDGRANAPSLYFASTTANHTSTHIHEMGHSIWGLADEYGENQPTGVNRIRITDTSEDNIPWKEFLNFRGVGLVRTSTPATKTNQYVPSGKCIMSDSHDPSSDFCEVCLHQIIKRGVNITQNEYFYIADPQLTISDDRPKTYLDIFYSTNLLETLELYDFNIQRGKNKHLDFRTVVDNMTTKPRNIKLRVYVSGEAGLEEFSQPYHIEPGEIKQLKLITSKTLGEVENGVNTIIGQVIDSDTNEVLATNYDRLNYSNLNTESYWGQDFGKKLYTVTIKFLDNKTGQPLPNIKPSILIKRNKEKFQLEKILFNGYRLNETKSKIGNNITIDGQNLEFSYYYDALPYKSLKLKLVDDSNNVIQEKVVKVYEGQKFIPKSSDFFLYDLKALNDSNNENEKWNNSVISPTSTYLYDEITDNQTELIYKISSESPTYVIAKDIEMIQGDDSRSVLINDVNKKFKMGIFDHDFGTHVYNPSIIYSNIDTSTPGEYFFVYYFKNNMDIKESHHSLFKIKVIVKENQNPNFVANPLEAEKNRLQSYNYLWIDQLENYKGYMQDFEAINQNNLLNNISNFNFNYDKFNYEVLEFQKLYPNVSGETFLGYKFKIKITDKTSSASIVTDYFTKNIWLKEDAPITPPTEEVEMQNEIDRINSLSLSLKNPILTQEEVNNINQDNILESVNGWVQTSGFAYEIINFNNSNNQFTFNIKLSKANATITKTSNLFTLSYQIKSEQTEQELLQQEINRINNLTLSLANNAFSQQEIDQINNSNFVNKLSNWNLVTSNSSKYNYEITSFDKANNKFTFNIKVTLISNPSISQTSNQFSLDYQITTSVNQDLINEKNRIDRLDLSFNKQEFSPDEIKGILDGTISITEYLNNWSGNNDQFNYQFIVNRLSDNELSLTIQIKDKNNPSEYRNSKSFVLRYEPSNSSNNLTTVILASTLAPAGAIAAGVAGTIIYKKKKRKY